MGDVKQYWEGRKVLVTGGGGYLGSELGRFLADLGAKVLLLDIRFNAAATSLAESRMDVHAISINLLDEVQLSEICTAFHPDFVFHCAALLDRSRDFNVYPRLYQANVQGTLNLLQALAGVDYSCFVYCSSSEIYGQNPLPFHEDQAPDPASPYSLTKLMGEQVIRTYSGIHTRPFLILRLFNFYGPGMPENTFIPQLLGARDRSETFVMSKGEQKRDYLLTADLVPAMVQLAALPETHGEIINLCSGNSVSMAEIADVVLQKPGNSFTIEKSMPYRANEIWEIRGSNAKLLHYLPDFNPKSLFEGL